MLYLIASGKPGFDVATVFASNGYGTHSPGGYSLPAALLTEVVMTMFFLIVILGATAKRAPAAFAPIAIGLALTLIHLISIPVTNTSVNPGRSTRVALYVGDWAVAQLWLFWLAPIAGAALGALTYCLIGKEYARVAAIFLSCCRPSLTVKNVLIRSDIQPAPQVRSAA